VFLPIVFCRGRGNNTVIWSILAAPLDIFAVRRLKGLDRIRRKRLSTRGVACRLCGSINEREGQASPAVLFIAERGRLSGDFAFWRVCCSHSTRSFFFAVTRSASTFRKASLRAIWSSVFFKRQLGCPPRILIAVMPVAHSGARQRLCVAAGIYR
jgi:hypothetical protein